MVYQVSMTENNNQVTLIFDLSAFFVIKFFSHSNLILDYFYFHYSNMAAYEMC